MNCYTFRVEPNQVTWWIGSELIDSSYQPVNGSQLLDIVDQTYRHYITLNGSFSVGVSISCNTSVGGTTSSLTYELQGKLTDALAYNVVFTLTTGISSAPTQPPSGLSATILSSSSLSISWMSVSYAVGYIVYYNGGEAVLIEGQDSTNYTLEELTLATTYTVHVISYLYNYTDILMGKSSEVVVLFDGK